MGLGRMSGRPVNLSNRNLTKAYLAGAPLYDLWLYDGYSYNYYSTDLSGTNLSQADLTGANLSGATLTGTNLTNAYVRGARLGHLGITMSQLTSTVTRRHTLTNHRCDKRFLRHEICAGKRLSEFLRPISRDAVSGESTRLHNGTKGSIIRLQECWTSDCRTPLRGGSRCGAR